MHENVDVKDYFDELRRSYTGDSDEIQKWTGWNSKGKHGIGV